MPEKSYTELSPAVVPPGEPTPANYKKRIRMGASPPPWARGSPYGFLPDEDGSPLCLEVPHPMGWAADHKRGADGHGRVLLEPDVSLGGESASSGSR